MALTDKTARDTRLDNLETAVKQWAEKRRKQFEDQAAFSKALLKGRTGSERLNNTVVTSATDLLVDELNDFLTGL